MDLTNNKHFTEKANELKIQTIEKPFEILQSLSELSILLFRKIEHLVVDAGQTNRTQTKN